jgi:hypothetical protein
VAYTPPPPPPPPEAAIVSAPFDDAWQAVVQTFFERNIPVRTLEKASGLIESDDLRGELGRDCDCGSYLGIPIGGYGTYGGDAYYRLRVLVERSDSQSRITVRSSCRARHESIEGELDCRLSPEREEELRRAIGEKIRLRASSRES